MKAEVNKNRRKRLTPSPLFIVNVMPPALTVFLLQGQNNSKTSLNTTTPPLRQMTRSSQPFLRDVPWSKPIGDHLEVPLLCAVGYSFRPEMRKLLWARGHVRVRVCEHDAREPQGGGKTGGDAGQNPPDCCFSTLKIHCVVWSFLENVRNRHSKSNSNSQSFNSILQINM